MFARRTLLCLAPFFLIASAQAQTDPGPRAGSGAPTLSTAAVGVGGPISGLNTSELEYFTEGKTRFQEVEDVTDGFGPRFNGISCASCHAQPAVGGSSPATNPQVAAAPPGQM